MSLARQNSGGSDASGASAASGATRASKAFKEADHEGSGGEGHEQKNKALTGALFGVLFTLSKEKNDSKKVAMLTVLVDFFLLFILLVTPDYPWVIHRDAWIWKLLWYAEFHNPIAWQGWSFYLGIFYLLCTMLFLSVAMCVWVAWCFKNDSFPYLWPIKVLRVVVSLFFGMTYIASLNVFLIMLACDKIDGHWLHTVYLTECLAFPHTIHLLFGVVSAVMFAAVAYLMALAEHDLDPLSKGWLAMPHSMCELRAVALKTIISVVRIVGRPNPKVQGVVLCICFLLMFWYHLKLLPHYVAWMNCLRCALWAVLAWVALLLCILIFATDGHVEEHPMALHSKVYKKYHMPHAVSTANTTSEAVSATDAAAAAATDHHRRLFSEAAGYTPSHHTWQQQVMITHALWWGMLPVFILGGALAYARLLYMFRIAMKFKDEYQEGMRYKDVFRFREAYDVEIVSRVMRVWAEDEETLDPEAVELAETVFKAGLSTLAHEPFVQLAYSNFLADARGNLTSAWSHLELARKQHPNLSFRFSIFTREQEHKQKAATTSTGEAAVDLVSYVEFQRSHRMLMGYHKAAMLASKEFWQLLLRSDISLVALTKACHNIEVMESTASKTFQTVLERYPRSAKLLRSYGQFLEQVKNDPWSAAKYFSEAEKQEEMKDQQDDSEEQQIEGFGKIHEKNDAVITINATGIIQVANKAACRLFGYKMGELERKNVSILMPQPFSSKHNQFLRAYVTTGKENIINRVREVVALHKDRYIFPASIYVTKASGSGQDMVFMGVLRPVEVDGSLLKAYVMTSGMILCCDQAFTDTLGWSPADLAGKSLISFCTDAAQGTRMLEEASKLMQAGDEHETFSQDITMTHKYGDPVPLSLGCHLAGTANNRLFVMTFKRVGPPPLAFTIDQKGRILYATSSLCSMLGYNQKQIRNKTLTELLPAPFAQLHHPWMKEAETYAGRSKLDGAPCKQGHTVSLLTSNGAQVPVKLTMKELISDGDSENINWFIQATKSTRDAVNASRRISLRMNSLGNIERVLPADPCVFGFDQATLLGSNISLVVDTFQAWTEAGGQVPMGLGALISISANHPGVSWRVGVLKFNAAGAANTKRTNTRSRPAIMQIDVDLDEVDEDGNIMLTMHLWKADELTGMLEIGEDGVITRADPQASMILGVPASLLQRQHLSKVMKLPADTNIETLMAAHQPTKRGGISKPHRNTCSAKRSVEVHHHDGHPMTVSLQAVIRDINKRNRAQLLVKVVNTVRGTIDTIRDALEHNGHEDFELHAEPHDEDAGDQTLDGSHQHHHHHHHRHSSTSADPQRPTNTSIPGHLGGAAPSAPPLPSTGTPPRLSSTTLGFKLPLDKVVQAEQQAAAASGGGGATQRSDILATARMIDIDFGTPRPDDLTPRISARRRSDAVPSPVPEEPVRLPGEADRLDDPAHAPDEASSDQASTSPSDVLKRLPTQITANSRPSVSGGSATNSRSSDSGAGSQEEDEEEEEEEEDEEEEDEDSLQDPEARERKRSVRKVREWLSSDFAGVVNGIKGAPPAQEVIDGLLHRVGSNGAAGRGLRQSHSMKPRASATGTAQRLASMMAAERSGSINPRTSAANAALPRLPSVRINAPDDASDEPASPRKLVRVSSIKEMVKAAAEAEHATDGASAKVETEQDEPDNASSAGSEATTNSTNSATFKRGKRFKRLVKILCGKQSMEPLVLLRFHTWALIGMLVLAHLIAFIVTLNEISKQEMLMLSAKSAGEANVINHRILQVNRNIEASLRDYGLNHTESPGLGKQMLVLANQLEFLHHGLYLGFKTLHKPSDRGFWTMWHSKEIPATMFSDTNPPSQDMRNLSMWEAGNQYITAAREVSFLASKMQPGYNISNNRFWLYIYTNGLDSLDYGYDSSMDILIQQVRLSYFSFQKVMLSLLVIEGCVLSIFAIVYLLYLLRRVSVQRVATFSVFLFVPTGFLKQMASKKVKLGGEGDDSDAGSDHGGQQAKEVTEARTTERDALEADASRTSFAVQQTEPSVSNTHRSRRVSISCNKELDNELLPKFSTGKKLNWAENDSFVAVKRQSSIMSGISRRTASFAKRMSFTGANLVMNGKRFNNVWGDMVKVVWPFVAWSIAVIAVYGASYTRTRHMTRSVIDMNLALAEAALVPRIQYLMSEATLVPNPAYQKSIQAAIFDEVADLEDVHHRTLYGGPYALHVMTGSGIKEHIEVLSDGRVFFSKANANQYFRSKSCFASTGCFNTSSQFYSITHSALDAMMLRLLQEAKLLAEDFLEDLSPYNNTRYTYATQVGGHDLREGSMTAGVSSYKDSLTQTKYLRDVTVVLFIISLCLWVAYSILTFKPFMLNTLKVGARVAELLSQLPQDMDVEAMVQSAWKYVMHAQLQEDEDGEASPGPMVRKSTDIIRSRKRVVPLDASGRMDASFRIAAGGQSDFGSSNGDGAQAVAEGVVRGRKEIQMSDLVLRRRHNLLTQGEDAV